MSYAEKVSIFKCSDSGYARAKQSFNIKNTIEAVKLIQKGTTWLLYT